MFRQFYLHVFLVNFYMIVMLMNDSVDRLQSMSYRVDFQTIATTKYLFFISDRIETNHHS